MIRIDGSYGEGGGQILRYAVALSVLTNKPVEIINIRAKRPNPGLRAQHHTAISCMQSLCGADVEGLSVGSSKLTFSPGNVKPGDYKFDIGTAGSITLVFQACILCSLKTNNPITIKLRGGTDVKWSPSWDYFVNVFLPLVQKMGIKTEVKLIKRGYYPKGGGEAILKIFPVRNLQPLGLADKQVFKEIRGIINIANLPDHIAQRMKHTAIKVAVKNNLQTSITIDKTTSFSAGTGITLWCKSNSTVLGSTVIGEKGVSSEEIGENAANQLINDIKLGATIDTFAMDQILPYMALTEDKSVCMVRELSNHAKTNIWLLKQFFDVEIEINEKQELMQLSVNKRHI